MAVIRRFWIFVPLALVLAGGAAAMSESRFNAKDEFIPPADYREWVFLTSGLDMNYSDEPSGMDHSMFDNVFVDPASWKAFKATGRWPDKTVLVKEGRAGSTKGSINKHGQFQTEGHAPLEFHVRDEKRFEGGWGFFVSENGQPARLIPHAAGCYSCHEAHAAVDTTFVQFYPTAKPIAVKAGTYPKGAGD